MWCNKNGSMVLILYLLLPNVAAQGQHMPHCWQLLISLQCEAFCKGSLPPIPTIPLLPPATTGNSDDPMNSLCPPILIWSPIEQLQSVLCDQPACPVCAEGAVPSSKLIPHGWVDGSLDKAQPRKIHDSNGVVLLVSRIYKCNVGHEILGHDPSILQKIPQVLVPFLLWHKTGVTKKLVTDISTLIDAGLTIASIETLLLRRRREDYIRRETLFLEMIHVNQPFPSFDDWSKQFPCITPGWHVIKTCYQVDFDTKKELYERYMQALTVSSGDDSWLSCDHTFASASNIGLSRDFDHRWITQCNSLFCVANEVGQVVTWKLTNSVAFSNVEEILHNLKKRLAMQKKVVQEFYVDICCSWRQKLKNVFGEHIKVYLDLFHAVKRITDSIPKRHPLRYECVCELTRVFRDPTDLGKVRQKATPSPEVMMANLDAFTLRWKEQTVDGRKVLPEAARHQISNLRKHIEKGCLSNIQPGRGTNRNEALHKSLNSHMKSARYGVEMAWMLLTTFFYNYNEKISAQREQRASKLVAEHRSWLQQISDNNEKFGLICDTSGHRNAPPTECSKSPLHFDRNSYYDFIARFTSYPASHPEFQENSQVLHSIDKDMTTEEEDEITVKDTIDILLRAIGWYAVHNTMSKYTSTAAVQCTEIPFMRSNFGYFLTSWSGTSHAKENDCDEHSRRLSNVLKSWNFVRVEVPGDGNCLFTSVAISITSMCQNGQSALTAILEKLGIDPCRDSIDAIVQALRKAVVNEWTGDFSHEYTGFLTHTQIEEHGQQFLSSGEFSGELGDLVIAALSNILHSPIVLFTSIPDLPVLVISPSHEIMHNPQPIHLAFTQHGPGHYDLAAYSDHAPTSSSYSVRPSPKCSCGRKTSSGAVCTTVLDKYASRCPCYNSRKACNEMCSCKNCHNPFGIAVKNQKLKLGTKRRRRAHETQKFLIRGVKTKVFMEETKMHCALGSPTAFERLITLSILQFLTTADASDFLGTSTHKVLAVYKNILSLVGLFSVELPMYQQSAEEIGKLILSCASKQIFFGKWI